MDFRRTSDPVRIAIIAEGGTDQIVIEAVLQGHFGEDAVEVAHVQPEFDATGAGQRAKANHPVTGWYEVLHACSSGRVEAALEWNDYVVVHIDTDVCEEKHFEVPRRRDGEELTANELRDAVETRLRTQIGDESLARIGDRILFAIAVDSIECWLLPFHSSQQAIRKKTVNCLGALNKAIAGKWMFTIDPERKDVRYYQRLSADLADRLKLRQNASVNPSLAYFSQLLGERAAQDEASNAK